MIATMANADLAMKKATVCFDEQCGNLDIMLSPNHVAFDALAAQLREIGFAHGVGPHWRLPLSAASLDRVAGDISDRLGSAVVWDCGKVYRRDSDPRPDAASLAPTFWGGERMLWVRDSGHCLVFDRQVSTDELWDHYEAEYRNYLTHEFYPSE